MTTVLRNRTMLRFNILWQVSAALIAVALGFKTFESGASDGSTNASLDLMFTTRTSHDETLHAQTKVAQGETLKVDLDVLYMNQNTVVSPEEKLYAPINVFFGTKATPALRMHTNDTVTITFYANTNKLGSRTVAWSDASEFSAASYRLETMGFVGIGFVWTNVPAGHYVFTARASCSTGLSATSAPVSATILPPPLPKHQDGKDINATQTKNSSLPHSTH